MKASLYRIEIEEVVPFAHNGFRARRMRDAFFARSWYDVGNVRYFQLDAYNIRAVGVGDVAKCEEVR